MQVMETCSPEKSQPNLITCVNVEAAHEGDAHALLPAISDTAQRELAPAEIPADTLYGGDDNLELDIEVISPVMSSPATISLSGFRVSCPAGRKPKKIKTGKNQGRVVHFDSLACDQCPNKTKCPVKRAKRSCSISYDAKALRLARRRTREKTACFREKYRFRAGIEATMSDLARITGIKHLRVRGDAPGETGGSIESDRTQHLKGKHVQTTAKNK